MHQPAKHDGVVTSTDRPGLLAPDTSGMNFYRADPALTDLLRIHLPDPLFRHIEPHLDRLGALAGGHLDECARIADRHVPVLHQRDRFGRDAQWIEYHPAYREMERIGRGATHVLQQDVPAAARQFVQEESLDEAASGFLEHEARREDSGVVKDEEVAGAE